MKGGAPSSGFTGAERPQNGDAAAAAGASTSSSNSNGAKGSSLWPGAQGAVLVAEDGWMLGGVGPSECAGLGEEEEGATVVPLQYLAGLWKWTRDGNDP